MKKYFYLLLVFACIIYAGEISQIGTYNALNSEIAASYGEQSSDGMWGVIHYSWAIGDRQPMLYKGVKPGTDYIGIIGMESIGKPGEPQIPAEFINLPVQGNIRIIGAELVSGEYTILNGTYNIVPKPEQLKRYQTNSNRNIQFAPNGNIYLNDNFFPGTWQKAWGGIGNNGSVANLQVMPLQYNPVTGQAALLTNAEFAVYYETVENSVTKRSMEECLETNAEHIIIAWNDFAGIVGMLTDPYSAERLEWDVIWMDSIIAHYDPADVPHTLPYIYDHYEINDTYFESYEAGTALRIVSYLADTIAHPNLKTITLFGDALVIPPSFYGVLGDYWDYNDFVPSDFLYASPDFDFIPNYGVTRLTADTPCEGGTIGSKINTYSSTITAEEFSNVLLAGGNPFENIYFDDEMTPNHIINDELTQGLNVSKSYATRGGFTADDITLTWNRDNVGFVYEMGHGSAYGIYFDDNSSLESVDVYDLEHTSTPPFHFAGVCDAGLFDDELITGFERASEYTYAEAQLYSGGGAIAFFGATRWSTGTPVYHFDGPELVIDNEEYIADMGYKLMQTLNDRPATLGEWMFNTITEYVSTNDMSDMDNIYTLYQFECFGDAGMAIPSPASTPISSELDITYPDSSRIINDYTAFIREAGSDINFGISNDAERYKVGYAMVSSDGYQVENETVIPGDDYTFTSTSSTSLYRIDFEDNFGREKRLYNYVGNGRYIIDGEPEEWRSSHIASTDPDDFDEDFLEVTDLYISDDSENYYFAFPFYDYYRTHRSYVLAIDSREGGYTYTDPIASSRDPFSNNVSFGGRFAVDFCFASRMWVYMDWDWFTNEHVGSEWNNDTESWNYDRWGISDFNGEMFTNADELFVEFRIPKETVGNYDSIAVILYVAPLDPHGSAHYPAQDAVPSDTATYNTLTTGYNTLTNFHVYHTGDNIRESVIKPKQSDITGIYPNPFNSTANISVKIIEDGYITVELLDNSGRLIEKLYNGYTHSGEKTIVYDFEYLPSGVYLVKTMLNGNTQLDKALYIK